MTFHKTLKQAILVLHRERFFKILALLFVVLLLSSIGIYGFEYHSQGRTGFKSIWDAIWWSLVTITTVGYGDTVPHTQSGRLVAMVTMLSGVFLLSLTTATIASVFVGRKIKEDKGLEAIRKKGHVVICGWNPGIEEVITGLSEQGRPRRLKLVLVNELSMDEIESIRHRHEYCDIEFVRGNFINENVLRRANVRHAEVVIVLSDTSGGRLLERADERTIMGTLTIKSLAPDTRTCAELQDSSNKEHLERAKVDEIVVRGGHTGILLAQAAYSTGIPKVVDMLLSSESKERFWNMEMPSRFVGQPIKAFVNYLRVEHQATLVAIVAEEKVMTLDDILSHDMTEIDAFIKQRFEESERDFFPKAEGQRVILNPDPDYVVGKHDRAVVISKKRP